MHAVRETIESIVIAFVLAFLFRTFEAEAFVIPTGSMSPSLQGQHKDVDCSECGYRFRASASSEGKEAHTRMMSRLQQSGIRGQLPNDISGQEVVAGMCPMCRQTMAFRPDLPLGVPSFVDQENIDSHTSYPGDRILVNKYSYLFNDPQRWDVVVFKYPGNGEDNYIKRLVGLPGETVQIYQGDIFTRPQGDNGPFNIERKPADKVQVMLQPVHDTDYDSAKLYQAGWPLRWNSTQGWEVETEIGEHTVAQKYKIDAQENADATAWLRYRHTLPEERDWAVVRKLASQGNEQTIESTTQWPSGVRPQLIRDFNPYNAMRKRNEIHHLGWDMLPHNLGMHWVSDLAVECLVEVETATGELILDLVKAGKHFRCTIDIKTGEASLDIDGLEDFRPTASTPVKATGSYEIKFANVDDQLLLWVDGALIEFEDSTYEVEKLFASREEMIPHTSSDDEGDLAPAGIGARGAKLSLERLRIWRDIYYIAVDWRDPRLSPDYDARRHAKQLPDGTPVPALESARQLFVDPASWTRFKTRQKREFVVDHGQLFVMGDNSPASSDCRLWAAGDGTNSRPGGPYLDKRLLIGKAVFVFWPHSWGSILGLPVLPGFPGFSDMRIVR